MSPQDWQRLKSLFEAAVELQEEERAEFVERSCPNDPELRDETLRLLAERASVPTGFLQPPGHQTLLDRAARTFAAFPAGYEGQLLTGRYLVEKEIGRGGSGIVYLAHDRQLHSRPVVLKFLHAAWEEHERVRLKFRHEIEALSRLNHPAVVGVLDVGQAPDGRSFLVMEYVDGVTLRARLRNGPLPFAEAAPIIQTLCDALEAAHRSGIVHRDIKPENIILLPGEENIRAKLIDFGIAKVQSSGYDAQTETVTVIGTVHYSAPEQLMGKSGPPSDVYALGVVSYEMLAGRRPLEPETPFELYELQKAGKITPPARISTEIPTAASEAILRALSFRPGDRQSSPRDFAVEFLAQRTSDRAGAFFRIGRLLVAFALLLAVVGWLLWARGWGRYDSVIEYVAAQDPEDFGFRPRLDLVEHAVRNAERTGFDAIRLTTNDQGYYYHKLSRAQAYAARRKGWKLELTMQVAEGSACSGIDLSPADGRYDICVIRSDTHRQFALVLKQIARGLDGPRYELSGPEDAWHDYQLVFDPGRRAARLLVDGVERLADYRGFREYLERWGLTFAAAIYRSPAADARFKRVHFEINP